MSKSYVWRPTGGYYYNSSGTSAAGDDHYYYSSNRSFRMDYPNLSGKLGLPGNRIIVKSAILHVHKTNAYSATLTMGYSYKTAYADRKSMLAKKTGISMGTSTGGMNIDLTAVIQAYVKDGATSTMRLWAYGTGGSTSNSAVRGYAPASSYNSQRPYITIVYEESNVRLFTDGEWMTAVPYVFHNGVWVPANIQLFDGDIWK